MVLLRLSNSKNLFLSKCINTVEVAASVDLNREFTICDENCIKEDDVEYIWRLIITSGSVGETTYIAYAGTLNSQ